MKSIILITLIVICAIPIIYAQSAILDVSSTSQGILIPSMTNIQRNAISDPTENLIIFQTDTTPGLRYFDGVAWQMMVGEFTLIDDDEDTWVSVERNADEDLIRFVIDGNEIARLDSTTFHLEAPGQSLFIGKDAGLSDSDTRVFYPHLGNRNTFIGYESGMATDTGYLNTGLGWKALNSHKSGSRNTAIGAGALFLDETGDDNTAIGFNTMLFNTKGDSNVAIGNIALVHNTIGLCNTAVGYRSMYANDSGSYNVALGYRSIFFSNSGNNNVAIGVASLYHNKSSDQIVAVGDSALYNNGKGALLIGQAIMNTAVGSNALYSNTTGSSNTALGHHAGYNNVTGVQNIFIGEKSGENQISGQQNIFIGNQAGAVNNGSGNIFIGWKSGSMESASNRLYLDNNNTPDPLIYGEFDNNLLQVNGQLNITEFMHLKPQSLAPASPTTGTIYYDQGTDKVKVWTGSAWEDLN